MGGHGRGNTLGHTRWLDCVVGGVFTVSGAPKGTKWDKEGWFAITANFVIPILGLLNPFSSPWVGREPMNTPVEMTNPFVRPNSETR